MEREPHNIKDQAVTWLDAYIVMLFGYLRMAHKIACHPYWIQYAIFSYVIPVTIVLVFLTSTVVGKHHGRSQARLFRLVHRTSAWICCHRGAMSSCRLPVGDPSLSNLLSSLDEIVGWSLPVLDYNDEAGIELPLRMINIR